MYFWTKILLKRSILHNFSLKYHNCHNQLWEQGSFNKLSQSFAYANGLLWHYISINGNFNPSVRWHHAGITAHTMSLQWMRSRSCLHRLTHWYKRYLKTLKCLMQIPVMSDFVKKLGFFVKKIGGGGVKMNCFNKHTMWSSQNLHYILQGTCTS